VKAGEEVKKEGMQEEKQDFCEREEPKEGGDRSSKQNTNKLEENDLNE
jgi:hypothetical protein